ncbi:cation:proton antiporter [Flavobacterium agricola]|uniref:Cation:proton antiporter n=1 Tax=Flavobacterium agricola TaxID=2870839 RepID=A0ABY6M1V9_9FLAO|nr:cation:proton antiporter [Flavobacterium agricola]UYW01695.1 cation:proton antiporter [Flavobacterium agricola]
MITATLSANTQHLYPLIADLGLILMTAGVSVLIFKKLKQPLVLGYLVAGFLAGNHFDLFPTVSESDSINVWAEIGVIILLFSLGLEFSFKKLMKVGGASSITAVVQIVAMIFIGYICGIALGWSTMNSLFLGAILSMSSTTIILRAFEEQDVKGKKFVSIVFGALIIEDIVAILLMVLLSTIAVSQNFSGTDLLISAIKLVFFLILWFLGGIFIIPTLLKKTKDLLTDETLLIVALALCLGMVILATKAGFSPALGAFIMGSIIAETTYAEKIEHLIKPVKDLFGAVFFVSVGMLINPGTLVEYAVPVLIITIVTIFGKTFFTGLGALLSGQPLKQSVQAGMSLAQIGEFSFIIATLGMTLGVTSEFLYPIVVAVSAVTTFTTPFMIKSSEKAYIKLEAILPTKLKLAIENYSYNSQSIKVTSNWQQFVKNNITQILLNSVIIIAIILFSEFYLSPMVADNKFGNVISGLITLVLVMPFCYAIGFRPFNEKMIESLSKEKKYSAPIFITRLFRISIVIMFLVFLLNIFFSPLVSLLALFAVFVLVSIFRKRIVNQYLRLESHFLSNFNDREIQSNKDAEMQNIKLDFYDGHLTNFTISNHLDLVGKTLEELKFREKIGVNVVQIKRGDVVIYIPSKDQRIFPGDEISIVGTDEQVIEFTQFLKEHETEASEEYNNLVLQKYTLYNPDFIDKSIRDSNLRELTKGLVICIDRPDCRILNPESDVVLRKNDELWIAGESKLLNKYFEL